MDLGPPHTFADLGAASNVARVDELAQRRRSTATQSVGQPAHGPRGRGVAAVRRRQDAAVRSPTDPRISEKTVARHISNIFVKITSSRSAATGYTLSARPHMTACAEIPMARSTEFAHFARCASGASFVRRRMTTETNTTETNSTETFDTIVIGGGQAGLAMGHALAERTLVRDPRRPPPCGRCVAHPLGFARAVHARPLLARCRACGSRRAAATM